jgi:hypothetical protein
LEFIWEAEPGLFISRNAHEAPRFLYPNVEAFGSAALFVIGPEFVAARVLAGRFARIH